MRAPLVRLVVVAGVGEPCIGEGAPVSPGGAFSEGAFQGFGRGGELPNSRRVDVLPCGNEALEPDRDI